MSLALHYWMGDAHHCSGLSSPKWPILCCIVLCCAVLCCGQLVSRSVGRLVGRLVGWLANIKLNLGAKQIPNSVGNEVEKLIPQRGPSPRKECPKCNCFSLLHQLYIDPKIWFISIQNFPNYPTHTHTHTDKWVNQQSRSHIPLQC